VLCCVVLCVLTCRVVVKRPLHAPVSETAPDAVATCQSRDTRYDVVSCEPKRGQR
jgi:hypothetical protein